MHPLGAFVSLQRSLPTTPAAAVEGSSALRFPQGKQRRTCWAESCASSRARTSPATGLCSSAALGWASRSRSALCTTCASTQLAAAARSCIGATRRRSCPRTSFSWRLSAAHWSGTGAAWASRAVCAWTRRAPTRRPSPSHPARQPPRVCLHLPVPRPSVSSGTPLSPRCRKMVKVSRGGRSTMATGTSSSVSCDPMGPASPVVCPWAFAAALRRSLWRRVTRASGRGGGLRQRRRATQAWVPSPWSCASTPRASRRASSSASPRRAFSVSASPSTGTVGWRLHVIGLTTAEGNSRQGAWTAEHPSRR
mmetsp:Transcript_35590/g.102707  ORF Transcript_35590/g.102707 Transcript_35590/m.102707 type:complete len:308 (+) Transcript_35590:2002-2925(+)